VTPTLAYYHANSREAQNRQELDHGLNKRDLKQDERDNPAVSHLKEFSLEPPSMPQPSRRSSSDRGIAARIEVYTTDLNDEPSAQSRENRRTAGWCGSMPPMLDNDAGPSAAHAPPPPVGNRPANWGRQRGGLPSAIPNFDERPAANPHDFCWFPVSEADKLSGRKGLKARSNGKTHARFTPRRTRASGKIFFPRIESGRECGE